MKTKKEAIEIIRILKEYYPEATCSLDFTTPFEMMVAVMLSAQCTDERVNKTTPSLFGKYNTPQKMSQIKIEELEKIIHPCGFYKNKAKNIIAASKMLLEKYDSNVAFLNKTWLQCVLLLSFLYVIINKSIGGIVPKVIF
jgi:endonuclease-3